MSVLIASAARPDRRRLLRVAETLATAALAAPLTSRLALGQPRFAAYPFALGVASGDPVADGFVLWTRLAPDPLNGGGMPNEAVEVRWEVASDPRFLDLVRRDTALAAPEHGHAVHVDVQGLEPDRWYTTASSPAARPARSAAPAPSRHPAHPRSGCASPSPPASTSARATSPPTTR